MAKTCETALEIMDLMVSTSDVKADAITDHVTLGYEHLPEGNYTACIVDILQALSDAAGGIRYAGGYLYPFAFGGPIKWYLLNCIDAGPYTLTMDDILSVMVTATEDQYRYFIGLVDAYRVGLWNKPFNAEYYAALARGFL